MDTCVPLPKPVKLASILVIALLVLASCGAGDNDDASLDEDIAVEDVLSNASERLADTSSMRFSMDIEGDTIIDPAGTMRLLNAKGTMARPDRVDVQFQIEVVGSQTVSIRMITIGPKAWTTDIVTGQWVTAPREFGYNPAVLYDNQNGLGPVIGNIENPELVGIDEVNDRQVYHVSGTSPSDVIDPMTANTMQGENIGIDLWIDGETWDLVRLQVKEPDDSGNENPATWTMNLSRHDEDVTIDPPE